MLPTTAVLKHRGRKTWSLRACTDTWLISIQNSIPNSSRSLRMNVSFDWMHSKRTYLKIQFNVIYRTRNKRCDWCCSPTCHWSFISVSCPYKLYAKNKNLRSRSAVDNSARFWFLLVVLSQSKCYIVRKKKYDMTRVQCYHIRQGRCHHTDPRVPVIPSSPES